LTLISNQMQGTTIRNWEQNLPLEVATLIFEGIKLERWGRMVWTIP